MPTNDVETIIYDAAKDNRLSFYDLTPDEKCQIVAHLLASSEQALVDADFDLHLQAAIANALLCKGSYESLCKIYNVVMRLFLMGDAEHEPYFADAIQTLLSDKWDDLNHHPNEHYEHDVMQRNRDIKDAKRRMTPPY